MNKNCISTCILSVVFLSTFSACSLKKDADHMKSSMDEMKAATHQIQADSKRLGDSTDNLQHEVTFKESAYMMETNLRFMWGEDQVSGNLTADQTSVTEPDILLYAGIVIKSMWSQFWTGENAESTQSLDERMETSAEILMVRIKSHTPSDYQIDVMNPDVSYKGVASLGAKLDFTRYEFTRALAKKNLAPFTLYDVMVGALKNRDAMTREELLPLTTAKILQFQNEAIYLLQLRQNYLPMMVLTSMTSFKDLGTIGRLGMVVFSHSIDLNRFGVEQLKEWTLWLKAARQTRQDLRDMGIEPEYNTIFGSLLSKLNFGQFEILKLAPETLTGKQKLQYEFSQLYTELVKASLYPGIRNRGNAAVR